MDKKPDERYANNEGNNQLEGRNVIFEAFKNNRPIDKILIAKGEVTGSIKKIISIAKEKGYVVQEAPKSRLDEISITKNHQGVIAFVSAHEYASVDDILEKARSREQAPFIIILDHITDPYNLGAIIRSAEAAGVHGVIIPKKRASGLTPVVEKAASGALEYVPVARVSNIARTVEELRKHGIWTYCADASGSDMFKEKLTGPIALVIGAEGEGVSRIVKEKCDAAVSIPMFGEISSLNASVAAGVIMYEIIRQRHYIQNDGKPV